MDNGATDGDLYKDTFVHKGHLGTTTSRTVFIREIWEIEQDKHEKKLSKWKQAVYKDIGRPQHKRVWMINEHIVKF